MSTFIFLSELKASQEQSTADEAQTVACGHAGMRVEDASETAFRLGESGFAPRGTGHMGAFDLRVRIMRFAPRILRSPANPWASDSAAKSRLQEDA